jgi:hypothetical protein
MFHRGSIMMLALAATVLGGCYQLRTPIPPTQPLTDKETDAVLACQKAIVRASLRFTNNSTVQLTNCARRAVALRIDEDRMFQELPDKRAALAKSCDAAFTRVGKASTKMFDAMMAACTPVEHLVITDATRGDPLAFRSLAIYFDEMTEGDVVIDSVDDVAGLVCSAQVTSAVYTIGNQVLRISDAAGEYLGLDVDELRAHLSTFLHPRCRDIEV